MADLATQVRDYWEFTTTPLEVDELQLDRYPLHRPIRAPGTRRGLAAAFAAAIVVLLLVGGAVVALWSLGDSEPTITEPLPTIAPTVPVTVAEIVPTVPPVTVTAPAPTPPPATVPEAAPTPVEVPPTTPPVELPEVSWRRVDLEPGLGGFDVGRVIPIVDCTPGGSCSPIEGYVSFGEGLVEGAWSGVIWASADGVAWERVAVFPPEEGGTANQFINDVAYRQGTLVAVGGVDFHTGTVEARIWSSQDAGQTWTESASDAFASTLEDSTLSTIVAADEGFILSGAGGLWFSDDGFSWQKMLDVPDIPFRIARGGPGWVGIAGDIGRDQDGLNGIAYSLTSVDGREWTVHEQPTEPKAFQWSGIVDGPAGLVAVGQITGDIDLDDWDIYPVVWRSDNGSAWAVAPIDPDYSTFLNYYWLRAVERVGDWLLAVGASGSVYGGRIWPVMWMSPDGGDTWARVPTGDVEVFGTGVDLWDITVIDDPTAQPGTIKVMVTGSFDGGQPAIWLGTVSL